MTMVVLMTVMISAVMIAQAVRVNNKMQFGK